MVVEEAAVPAAHRVVGEHVAFADAEVVEVGEGGHVAVPADTGWGVPVGGGDELVGGGGGGEVGGCGDEGGGEWGFGEEDVGVEIFVVEAEVELADGL